MADPAGASGRENPVEPRSGPPYAGSRRAVSLHVPYNGQSCSSTD